MHLKFHSVLFTLLVSSVYVRGQIELNEIPPDLKYLYEGDLDVWEPPNEFKQKFPYYLSGFDYENRPIWIVEFGKWDIKKILDKGGKTQKDFYKYVDQWTYTLLNSLGLKATPEEPVKECIVIFDMEGYNLEQLNSSKAVSFLIRTLRLILGSLKFLETGYAVNTNAIAGALINILRPVFGKEFEKVVVLGTNSARWIPQLLRKIPRDQLPEWYGGVKDFKPLRVYG